MKFGKGFREKKKNKIVQFDEKQKICSGTLVLMRKAW